MEEDQQSEGQQSEGQQSEGQQMKASEQMEDQPWYRPETRTEEEQKKENERKRRIEDELTISAEKPKAKRQIRAPKNSSRKELTCAKSLSESWSEEFAPEEPKWPPVTPYNLLVCEDSLPDLLWKDWSESAVDCDSDQTVTSDFVGCFELLRRCTEPDIQLKKVKIYGPFPTFRPAQLKELLTPLSKLDGLEYLEVDRLIIEDRGDPTKQFDHQLRAIEEPARKEPDYKFRDLKCLVINSAAQANEKGEEICRLEHRAVTFGPQLLRWLYLGERSVHYVDVVDKQTVRRLSIDEDRTGKLHEFKGLHTLICNDALNMHLDSMFIKMREPRLRWVYLNIRRNATTNYKPTEEEIKKLNDHLDFLTEPADLNNDLQVYVHNVKIDPYKGLLGYGLHDTLLNLAKRYQSQDGCRMVVDTNYDLVTQNFDEEYLDMCESIRSATVLQAGIEQLRASAFPSGPIKSELYRSATWTKPIFQRFAQAFSFIQHVVVFNSDETRRVSLSLLVEFLCNCKVLVKLQTVSTGFGAAHYEQLTRQPTLASLWFLAIYEPQDLGRQLKTFEFLHRFKHLRLFSTNLASREQALQLIADHFRPNSLFTFYFNTTFRQRFNIFIVRRNKQHPANYDLELVDTYAPPVKSFSIWKLNQTAADLRACVTKPKQFGIPADFFDHWLDKERVSLEHQPVAGPSGLQNKLKHSLVI